MAKIGTDSVYVPIVYTTIPKLNRVHQSSHYLTMEQESFTPATSLQNRQKKQENLIFIHY